MSRRDRERRECPACGKTVTVRRDGGFMAHSDPAGVPCARPAWRDRVDPVSPTVWSVPRWKGYDGELEDRALVLADGTVVGGSYWAAADRAWASWGPAGLVRGQATRDAAEAAQAEAGGWNR